ncbi:MAG: septum formation initiator family protein [Myxococcota bacterium]|nr:septum formation initiator family protein [Myxococcota bacterium]
MPARLWIVPAVLAAAFAAAWLDEDAGLRTWARLRTDLRAAETRMADLRAEIAELERRASALADDAFAQERAIRAELGLARPGETVVRLRAEDDEDGLGRP